MPEKTRKIIQELKKIRLENDYTLQRIQDMMEEGGDFVSMTTLRRVFADGSEDVNFRYEDTIAPIAKVLIINDDCHEEAERIQALESIIVLKNERIAELEKQLDAERESAQRERNDAQRRIDFLKERLAKADERLEERGKYIKELFDRIPKGG